MSANYRLIPCSECHGEGVIEYGHPNDPHPRTVTCHFCDGSCTEEVEVEEIEMEDLPEIPIAAE